MVKVGGWMVFVGWCVIAENAWTGRRGDREAGRWRTYELNSGKDES